MRLQKWAAAAVAACLLLSPMAAVAEESSASPSQAASSTSSSSAPPSSAASSEASPESASPASNPSGPSSADSSSRRKTDITSPANQAEFQWTQEMSDSLGLACKWLDLNDTNDSYLVVSGIAGHPANVSVSTRYIAAIAARAGQYDAAQQLTRDILILVFSSLNPADYNGLDLIETLYTFAGLDAAPLADNAGALMALDSNHFDVPESAVNSRSVLLHRILALQQENGGFAPQAGLSATVRATADALTALAPYRDEQAVRTAAQRGLEWLQTQQNQNGSFGSPANSDLVGDLSGVITALCSLSLSPSDARFSKQGTDLITHLLKFQLSDGGFPTQTGTTANMQATEAAVVALTAAEHQTSPFVLRNSVTYHSSAQSTQPPDVFSRVALAAAATLLLAAAAVVTVVLLHRRKRKALSKTKGADSK